MRRSRRALWWGVFGAGSTAVIAGLAWISAQVVRLEREEALARAEVAEQETLHLALWRMDSWLAPHLARESARTWFEYQSYYPEMLALNRLCEPLAPGEVVVPSPLLEFRSELFPLHVQYSPESGFTSPQVPSPDIVTSGVVGCVPGGPDDELEARLRAFVYDNNGEVLLIAVRAAEAKSPWQAIGSASSAFDRSSGAQATGRSARESLWTAAPKGAGGTFNGAAMAQQDMAPSEVRDAQIEVKTVASRDIWDTRNRRLKEESEAEFKARQSVASQVQNMYMEGNQAAPRSTEVPAPQNRLLQQVESAALRPTAEVGPLVPIWLGLPADQLLLARRVTLGDEELLQGVVIDWYVLQHDLLARVEDLFPSPDARLEPVVDGSTSGSGLLASLPVRFVPPELRKAPPTIGRGVAMGLIVVWLVALGAIGTTGIAMNSTLRAAMQTSRFASSVTHELRTPLTTFRLYAEMLSDGLVADPAKAREYLRTLRDESTRLGLLVENVLAWSRLEEGRKAAEPRSMAAGDLVVDAEPVLKRRCEEAGATLVTRMDSEDEVQADPSRVRQILFNLVDNACKYAGDHAQVEVTASRRNGSVVLTVDDDGPGVPPAQRRTIFRAFNRGALGPGDSVRGLGLGLSISQELAQSMGGSLLCGQSPLGGARFELELPATGHDHDAVR